MCRGCPKIRYRADPAALRSGAGTAVARPVAAPGGSRAYPPPNDAPHRLRWIDRNFSARAFDTLPGIFRKRLFTVAEVTGPIRRLRGLAAPVAARRDRDCPARLLAHAAWRQPTRIAVAY